MVNFTDEFCQALFVDNGKAAASSFLLVGDDHHQEEMLPGLIKLAATKAQVLNLIQELAAADLERHSTLGSFLQASFAVRSVVIYMLMDGKKFLDQFLGEYLRGMLQSKQFMFEMDPHRLSKGQDAKESQENLKRSVQQLLDSLQTKIAAFPANVKKAISLLVELASVKFPESKKAIVAEVVFRRIMGCCIALPVATDILTKGSTSPAAERNLALLGKLLSHVGSGDNFDVRWEYMKPLEPFVAEQQPAVVQIADQLSSLSTSSKELPVALDSRPFAHIESELLGITTGLEMLSVGCVVSEKEHCSHYADKVTEYFETDRVVSLLEEVKDQIKAQVPNTENLLTLLKTWNEAKTKGTTAAAMIAATRETQTGLSYTPQQRKLEEDATAISKTFVEAVLGAQWLAADDVGGVQISIAEEGVSVVPEDQFSVKGSVRVAHSTVKVLESLHNLSTRSRWDPLCNGGATELQKIGNSTRVLLLESKSPNAEYVVLEHYSPSVNNMGGGLAFSSIDFSVPFQTSRPRSVLTMCGFTVQPIAGNENACQVIYIINGKFPGVAPDDAWGPALELLHALKNIEKVQ